LTDSLGKTTSRGAVALASQVISTRLIVFATQLVLAYELSEEDFGSAGIAQAIAGVASVFVTLNIESVLIKRKKHLNLWAPPAFWMTFCVGLLGSLCVLLTGLFSNQVQDNKCLSLLLLILAISMPIRTIAAVPNAIITANLRFNALAIVGALSIVATSGLSICFAVLGFGAASLVLPIPIVALLNIVILFWLSDFRPTFFMHLTRWRYLIQDTGRFWGVQVIWTLFGQIDYILLAFFLSKKDVGEYFFAYMMATQAVRITSGNLYFVMFPVLTSMGSDYARQAQAAIRTCRTIPILLVPACLAQAIFCYPLIDFLYPNKWETAATIVCILSAGLSVYPVSFIGEALMHAQGRFREYYILMAFSLTLFVLCVTIGANFLGVTGAALGVSTHFLLVSPFVTVMAFKNQYDALTVLVEVYGKPLAIGLVIYFVCVGLGRLAEQFGLDKFTSSVLAGAFSPVLFLVVAVKLLPKRIEGLIDVWRGKINGKAY